MLLAVPLAACAEDGGAAIPAIGASGSLRAAYYSDSRDLDGRSGIGVGALWLQNRALLVRDNVTIRAFAESWLQREVARQEPPLMVHGRTEGAVREAWIEVGGTALKARVGRQIIAWGRADKINPTDNLTPRDYRLQVAADEDQRLGAPAALLRLAPEAAPVSVSVVWMPHIVPNRGPLPRVPGRRFREMVPARDQIAIKLDHTGGGVDWSLSALDGVQLNPDLVPAAAADADGARSVLLQHQHVRVLGMDAATVIGRYGVRAELASTWTEPAAGAGAPWRSRPALYAVVGAERRVADTVDVNVQYFVYRVRDYADPASIADPLAMQLAVQGAAANLQRAPARRGLSLRLAGRWLDDALDGELVAVHSVTAGDSALRARLSYAINSALTVTAGWDRFLGKDDTYFGRIRATSTALTELRWHF